MSKKDHSKYLRISKDLTLQQREEDSQLFKGWQEKRPYRDRRARLRQSDMAERQGRQHRRIPRGV